VIGRAELGFGSTLVKVVAATRYCAARPDAGIVPPLLSPRPPSRTRSLATTVGHVFLLTAGLSSRSGLPGGLDVDLAALLQIFSGILQRCQSTTLCPLGAILPLAALVFETLVGGERDLATGVPLVVYFDFGSLPRLPMEDYSCDAFSCSGSAPYVMGLPERNGKASPAAETFARSGGSNIPEGGRGSCAESPGFCCRGTKSHRRGCGVRAAGGSNSCKGQAANWAVRGIITAMPAQPGATRAVGMVPDD